MGQDAKETMGLENGARVIVLGGGPSSAFFALHLLSLARDAGKRVHVTIVDQKMGPAPGNGVEEMPGCNFCAGMISPRLQKGLARYGIRLPDTVLCHRFTHIWIHGQWKNFPLRIPRGSHMLSVFRGSLPGKRPDEIRGLDAFLLEKARKQGAQLVRGRALDLNYTVEGLPCTVIETPEGKRIVLEGEFLMVCTGINGGRGSLSLFRSFARLHPGFVPPKTRRSLVFELMPGRAYLKKYMDREIYIIVSGAGALDLDHAALVPKKDCLTVALTGKSIDRADFPQDTKAIIHAFFSLEAVPHILPGLDFKNCPAVCTCTPVMAVSPSRMPYGHRMGMAGDAMGARLYRDGLYSAFSLTRDLAGALMGEGVDEKSLARVYSRAGQWLDRDNTRGRRFMGIFQGLLKSPFMSRVLYQTFATEMKFKTSDQWPAGRLLWQVGSGADDFPPVFKTLVSAPVLKSLARGAVKTVRNICTERFFGLSWETYGRYPAVVIREKRRYIKASISDALGICLDENPEMERMYAVKIRAPASAIYEELGRFGEPGGRFLRLRFVGVNRVFGRANQKGAVVRYSPWFFPIAMDVRLVKRIREKTLVYEPSPLFARNGKLIFDIRPTRDGNNRLVVYTAFDYRRGRKGFSRIFWRVFKFIFPDFAHDVVWNHAVCCIKGEAEKAGSGPSERA